MGVRTHVKNRLLIGCRLSITAAIVGWLAAQPPIQAQGGVAPGVHRLIRFTVMTPNIATEDIGVGDPNEHIAAGDGLFEFATCHQHYHFRHYAQYPVIDCGIPPREGKCHSCGAIAVPGHQGVTAGWADTYRFFLGGQYFVLDGGDGREPAP